MPSRSLGRGHAHRQRDARRRRREREQQRVGRSRARTRATPIRPTNRRSGISTSGDMEREPGDDDQSRTPPGSTAGRCPIAARSPRSGSPTADRREPHQPLNHDHRHVVDRREEATPAADAAPRQRRRRRAEDDDGEDHGEQVALRGRGDRILRDDADQRLRRASAPPGCRRSRRRRRDSKRLAIASRTAGSSPVPTPRDQRDRRPDHRREHRRDRGSSASVRPPILPSRRMSPSDATPTKRLAITSGITTIVISRMKIVPAGSIHSTTVGERRTPTARRRRWRRRRRDRRGCVVWSCHRVASTSRERRRACARHRPDGCRPCGRCETPSAESARGRRPSGSRAP